MARYGVGASPSGDPPPASLALVRDDFRLTLSVSGGSILSFDHGTTAIFRPASPATAPFPFANFPLLPFSNRIAGGQFIFEGRRFHLQPNIALAEFPLPIHGFGWQAVWKIVDAVANRAHLRWVCRDGRWPQPFLAEQSLELCDDGYDHRLCITNIGDGPMPAGLGLHPYFPAGAIAMDTDFGGRHVTGADGIPDHWEALNAQPGWFDGSPCDQGFTGRMRPIRIRWPRHSVVIDPDPVFSDTMIYIPPGRDHFCVEPVTHRTDAINGHEGMTILLPGQTLKGSVRFSFLSER
jgi:aldose 1-epimerase